MEAPLASAPAATSGRRGAHSRPPSPPPALRYPGVVTEVSPDGSFTLRYEDGETEKGISAAMIRSLPPGHAAGSEADPEKEMTYTTQDNDSPALIATALGVDADALVARNRARHKGPCATCAT